MSSRIYMDYHATTPADPRVVEAMMPYFSERFGNAASRTHLFGWEAEEAVEKARGQVAELVGAAAREIVFTSGATESDNLAIRGAAEANRDRGDHLVTVVTEHPAVLDSCRALEKRGFRVTWLPVGRDGLIRLEELEKALTEKTILVSVMYANNEIGVLQPIAEIGRIARAKGVLFHCDATQGAGKGAIRAADLGIDLLSFSAHKLCGPKGIGALYVRRKSPRIRIQPILEGGGHEKGLRSGTLNTPAIVGFGKACEICGLEMGEEQERIGGLRDRLERGLRARLDEVHLNGHPVKRLAGNLNLAFAQAEGDAIMMGMREVAVSSGSACTSAKPEPSHVLRALGIGDDLVHASLRFGLGRFTTADEVDTVIEKVTAQVNRLRAHSPHWQRRHQRVERQE